MRCLILFLLCAQLCAAEQTIENLADNLSFAISLQDSTEAKSCWASADHIIALSKTNKVSISKEEQKNIKNVVKKRDAAVKQHLASLFKEAKTHNLDLSSLSADTCTLTDNANAVFKGNKHCTILFKSNKGFSLRLSSTGVRKIGKHWLFVDGIQDITLIKKGKELKVPKQVLP